MSRIASGVLALLICSASWASPFESVAVYTDAWPPYVKGPDEEQGVITRIVEIALRDLRKEPEWHYVDFYLAYDMVKQGEIRLSYPFFKTRNRVRNDPSVLFSDKIVDVVNALYYSRQHNDFGGDTINVSNYRIGRVSGYSYGNNLEPYLTEATLFQSEILALKALLDGDIDLLPMTEKVAQALVLKHFPLHYPDFRQLPGADYRSTDGVHLITVNDEAGQAFIDDFNRSLEKLTNDRKIAEALEVLLEPPRGSGYVRLVAGDNHPVVIGQTNKNSDSSDNRYLMIPQGTRALVLEWSEAVFVEFESAQLYPTMTQLTRVRVVDGPHPGRDLFVKNLHIEIE